MIEKKTTFEIFKENFNFVKKTHKKEIFMNPDNEWGSVESLLPKLIEADNKLTPIQTKVALKRIIKELEK